MELFGRIRSGHMGKIRLANKNRIQLHSTVYFQHGDWYINRVQTKEKLSCASVTDTRITLANNFCCDILVLLLIVLTSRYINIKRVCVLSATGLIGATRQTHNCVYLVFTTCLLYIVCWPRSHHLILIYKHPWATIRPL